VRLTLLRREDVVALNAMLAPDVAWQGLRNEWACHGAESVIDIVAIEDVPLPDGIYNVFTLETGTIIRIDDFADRHEALAAAGWAGRRLADAFVQLAAGLRLARRRG
jgi:hypothetical protein